MATVTVQAVATVAGYGNTESYVMETVAVQVMATVTVQVMATVAVRVMATVTVQVTATVTVQVKQQSQYGLW